MRGNYETSISGGNHILALRLSEEALRKMNSIINRMAILFLMAIVAGCGGSGAFTSSSSSATSSTGSGGTTGQPSISLALTDSSGASTTSISVDSPGTVKATVVDENGSPVAGAVVTFTATLATFNPTSGSVLTDSRRISASLFCHLGLKIEGFQFIGSSCQFGWFGKVLLQ